MSLSAKLKHAQAELTARKLDHPWKLPLERVRGKVDYDGVERLSTQKLLDILEVPQSKRNTETYRALARVMAELGWMPVRVRDMTRGGYLEQVRGYAREPRDDARRARQ
jgi:hypothetical protein